MFIDINTIKRTSDLPQNDRFFDLYDGDKLIAHICFPLHNEAERRAHVVFYDDARQITETLYSNTPVVTVRARHQGDMRRKAIAAAALLATTIVIETKEETKPMTKRAENNIKAERNAAYAKLLAAAYEAANAAQVGMVENHRALDCGFAWVEVTPRNHPFVKWCKAQTKAAKLDSDARKYGSDHGTAWTFWKPGNFTGQAIGIHEAGSKAFRDVLALGDGMGGAQVRACSRYD